MTKKISSYHKLKDKVEKLERDKEKLERDKEQLIAGFNTTIVKHINYEQKLVESINNYKRITGIMPDGSNFGRDIL